MPRRTELELPAAPRREGLDVLRGLLLVAMLAVHILSGHASVGLANAMHSGFGVFLISAGFVGLSGFMVGMRLGRSPTAGSATAGSTTTGWMRGWDSAMHLLVAMVAYGIVVSLLRFALAHVAGGEVQCSVRDGWSPPTRFESLGIFLPLALVQLQASWLGAGAPGRTRLVAVLALAWMLLPALPHPLGVGPLDAVLDALTRRTVTPYYTVSTYVAVGLVFGILGASGVRLLERGAARSWQRWVAVAVAVVLTSPVVNGPAMQPAAQAGAVVGGLFTLSYWLVPLVALLWAFCGAGAAPSNAVAWVLALLGRHSLSAFLMHELLLELNNVTVLAWNVDKQLWTTGLLFATNLAVLVAFAYGLERWPSWRLVAQRLLLARPNTPMFRWSGATPSLLLAGAIVLATYSSFALAGSEATLQVDNFDGPEQCPRWWSFGALKLSRSGAAENGRGRYLEVRGAAPATAAHGFGVFPDQDLRGRRTLHLDVRGYGLGSGRLRVELMDDDNWNWQLEQDEQYVPRHDDRFVRELDVDWVGWRDVVLPADTFVDDNPAAGNNVFDPDRDLTSGGLLVVQLLVRASTPATDQIQLDIDNVRWSR